MPLARFNYSVGSGSQRFLRMPDFTTLSDPNGRVRIEYSRPAMHEIRRRAIDGLMALPRIGMGVGGLLVGVRQEGVIRVVNSIPIPCSHAGGPSFNLTEAERKHVTELIAGAAKPGVIGWYCSKTRGTPSLADSESAMFRDLFPGAGPIALVIRPSTVMPVRAAFYVRDAAGSIVDGIECDLEDTIPFEGEEEKKNSSSAAPVLVSETPDATRETPIPEPPPPPPEPAISRPAPAPIIPHEIDHRDRRPNSRLKSWMFVVAACVALAALFFFSRDLWLPAPPLALTLAQSNGKLEIRWNTEAFRGMDRASLTINDGGDLHTLSLDRSQLNQGEYIHTPASQRVTAKISAGEKSAIAVWFAPEPKGPPPVQAAQTPVPQPKSTPRHAPIPDDR